MLVKKVVFNLYVAMPRGKIFLTSCWSHQIILQAVTAFSNRDYRVGRTRVLVVGMDPMGLALLFGLQSLASVHGLHDLRLFIFHDLKIPRGDIKPQTYMGISIFISGIFFESQYFLLVVKNLNRCLFIG